MSRGLNATVMDTVEPIGCDRLNAPYRLCIRPNKWQRTIKTKDVQSRKSHKQTNKQKKVGPSSREEKDKNKRQSINHWPWSQTGMTYSKLHIILQARETYKELSFTAFRITKLKLQHRYHHSQATVQSNTISKIGLFNVIWQKTSTVECVLKLHSYFKATLDIWPNKTECTE